jgi:biotin operon repressor
MTQPIKFKQQFDWVLLLVSALQEPKSLEELQDISCTSERSVYRWIDHLRQMGFEVRRSGKKNRRTWKITNENKELKGRCLKLASACDPSEN